MNGFTMWATQFPVQRHGLSSSSIITYGAPRPLVYEERIKPEQLCATPALPIIQMAAGNHSSSVTQPVKNIQTGVGKKASHPQLMHFGVGNVLYCGMPGNILSYHIFIILGPLDFALLLDLKGKWKITANIVEKSTRPSTKSSWDMWFA
ncbi:hypothetical protein HGM15179_002288 [Zosterops borbonicus]|uniref:Uncharacterized protein n=1 Tax=Zosterops borbonicus TaxID=364589 RepID=A0A8K1GUY6_9PASS|nr:hypothetical protein HGM15179_002288 [Zosterops borbonicus]